MAKKTNLTTKRFGPRYGRTVKQKVAKIEALAKKTYKCPYCSAEKVKKKTAGIWECRKCDKVFTSKAYTVDKAVFSKKE
jgi:large subunit ribosomal protein L37Ae